MLSRLKDIYIYIYIYFSRFDPLVSPGLMRKFPEKGPDCYWFSLLVLAIDSVLDAIHGMRD